MMKGGLLYNTRRKLQVLALTATSPEFMSKIYFRVLLGYRLDLSSPNTFNEKLQWLKLYYWPNNMNAVHCTDKYAVRRYIESIDKSKLLNELYFVWDDVEQIEWEKLPDKFVLKCNHGCGYNIICKDKNKIDKNETIKRLKKWMSEDFSKFNAEPHYGKIERKIICEKFLEGEIINYNIYVFNGKAVFFSVAGGLGDGVGEHLTYYNIDGSMADFRNKNYPAKKDELSPILSEMIATAEYLAKGFPMVRVDLFDVDGKIVLSEMTFTPGGALIPFDSYEADALLGKQLDIHNEIRNYKKTELIKKDLVLVVMGGVSSEREVSFRTGEALYQALNNKKYNVEKFVLNESNAVEIVKRKPKCVVLALHGKGGEDGCIQGMLELAGIPYTGAGVACSAICMNKIHTKQILSYENIQTADFLAVTSNMNINKIELANEAYEKLGFPVVVKAPCQGSSVGISVVRDKAELQEVIDEIFKIDNQLLIEKYVSGRELTVPVMRKQNTIITFPIVEILSENKFYDYEAKYTIGRSKHIVPAQIGTEEEKKIEELAVRTYEVLDCDGLVRVDFLLEKGSPYVMEVNTLPGMTETSLVPDSARSAGIEFDDLAEKLLIDSGVKSLG